MKETQECGIRVSLDENRVNIAEWKKSYHTVGLCNELDETHSSNFCSTKSGKFHKGRNFLQTEGVAVLRVPFFFFFFFSFVRRSLVRHEKYFILFWFPFGQLLPLSVPRRAVPFFRSFHPRRNGNTDAAFMHLVMQASTIRARTNCRDIKKENRDGRSSNAMRQLFTRADQGRK